MNTTITIRADFRDLIPPLAPAELEQLHKSLDAHGCADSLTVWRGQNVLLDGHNRYAYCTANGIPFNTREIYCTNEDTARNWIILNQLGRRNMEPKAISALRGELYHGRKKEEGNATGRNQHSEELDQNELVPLPQSTAEIIAKETGVSPATVKRDAKFAEAAKTLGVMQDVISGKDKRTKTEIIKAADEVKPPSTKEQNPKPAKPKPESTKWKSVVKSFKALEYSDQQKAIEEISTYFDTL